jgi:hypothetical protein
MAKLVLGRNSQMMCKALIMLIGPRLWFDVQNMTD